MSVVVELARKARPHPNPSLESLTALTATDMEAVNRTIVERMQSSVSAGLPARRAHRRGRRQAAPPDDHPRRRANVRLRRRAAYRARRMRRTHPYRDPAPRRRGRRERFCAGAPRRPNAVWGNQASVLVGDFLFSRSFELMVADASLDVLAILSEASSVIAEGEVLQLMTAKRHRHRRGGLSRRHPRQDRETVRGGRGNRRRRLRSSRPPSARR